jgi:hypothetical protein
LLGAIENIGDAQLAKTPRSTGLPGADDGGELDLDGMNFDDLLFSTGALHVFISFDYTPDGFLWYPNSDTAALRSKATKLRHLDIDRRMN